MTTRNDHSMVAKVDIASFEIEVLKSAKPVLVNFSMKGCAPCERIAPFLEEIATELAGKVKIVKLDIVENPELAAQYGVRWAPGLAIFKGGEVADIAAPKTELRSWISQMIQTAKETR
ncbi:thioredoxin family protein [Sinorhizobium meliloti]|uniref:thioredoxin family protein n=2 Tax=Rhizobium meliloti TaxID=382 RepID=UPI001F2E4409|nr:thioredoxin domain-containing protein [Sinorhizobium meliloti]